jgi:uncharacterized repeat protein (TIGR02543 family)
MKKVILLLLVLSIFLSIKVTLAFYNTSDNINSDYLSEEYSIKINTNGGSVNSSSLIVVNNVSDLPTIEKIGYNFLGYSLNENSDVMYSKNINNIYTLKNIQLYAKWQVINYSINYNLNGGSVNYYPNTYNVEQTITLPTPTKTGYSFSGWTGTGLNSLTNNVTIKNSIGNRSYTANYNKNYYTVNYYVNGNLWAQRKVGYNDSIEDLNPQSSLDNYHKFNGWNGWTSTMSTNDVNLYANITETYCQLITGHGPYANATALLSIFNQAGWSGNVIEAPSAPGYYLVVTDYNLTRVQAENQKNYIASHTNYTNYRYPYLYWVAISCTNGYGEAWTRGSGQSTFN